MCSTEYHGHTIEQQARRNSTHNKIFAAVIAHYSHGAMLLIQLESAKHSKPKYSNNKLTAVVNTVIPNTANKTLKTR